jgi:hypothetical protein
VLLGAIATGVRDRSFRLWLSQFKLLLSQFKLSLPSAATSSKMHPVVNANAAIGFMLRFMPESWWCQAVAVLAVRE